MGEQCEHCWQTPCVCEPDTPELRAKMLGMWPGDPTKRLRPVTREMEIELAKRGVFKERMRIRKDGSVTVIPEDAQ